MSHAITLGDVLWTSGIVIAVLVVLGLAIGFLSIIGSAFKD